MKIAYSWLKEYMALTESAEEIGAILTQTGLEVEGIEEFHQVEGGLQGLVLGEVLTCKKHPDATLVLKLVPETAKNTLYLDLFSAACFNMATTMT